LTDLGNAERMRDYFGGEIRYVPERGCWLVWDGSRWSLDSLERVKEIAKRTVRTIYEKESKVARSDADRTDIAKHAIRSETDARQRAMLALASTTLPELKVAVDELDAHPALLNCPNGTVELTTGALRSHDREQLITKVCAVDYDPDARCPRWRAFLEEIFAGDRELIAFMQRAAGYSATGSAAEEVFFLLVGAGKNGKSTFQSVVTNILGDYASHTGFDTFLAARFGRGSATFDIARLAGARWIGAGEPAPGSRWDEARLKRFTGGEPVNAAFKYENEFEYTPVGKLWFLANDPPAARDTGEAMRRRLLLVPFAVTIAAEKRVLDFAGSLRDEYAGILAWIVQGAAQWYREGLMPPPCVRRASDEYLEDADTIGRFLSDCCRTAVGDRTLRAGATAIHTRYQAWCADEGVKPISRVALGRDLGRRGFGHVKAHGVTTYLGIDLASTCTLESAQNENGGVNNGLSTKTPIRALMGVLVKTPTITPPLPRSVPIVPESAAEQLAIDEYELAHRTGARDD
jgi:putative DNA primase/helicase